jgi:NDP-sugar pyrophosphorylase family protein
MNAPAAFVLAAGLGTRLRPLTDLLPKPLIPVFHKPLITFALDSLMAAGAGTLVLNTHHLPETFAEVFGVKPSYREREVQLFHEPELLDTGGGMRNARSSLGEATFFLYNGDILADLPLAELLLHHRTSGTMATLLLKTSGGTANIRFDADSGRVLDLRGALEIEEGVLTVYSGIALFEPAIFDWIPAEGPASIIDALLAALRAGEQIGGMMSEGFWLDLGTPASYREAHHLLADSTHRPSFLVDHSWPQAIHPEAHVDPSVVIKGVVSVGAGAVIGKGVFLRDSILWPGAVIQSGARIEESIVRGVEPIRGVHQGVIL